MMKQSSILSFFTPKSNGGSPALPNANGASTSSNSNGGVKSSPKTPKSVQKGKGQGTGKRARGSSSNPNPSLSEDEDEKKRKTKKNKINDDKTTTPRRKSKEFRRVRMVIDSEDEKDDDVMEVDKDENDRDSDYKPNGSESEKEDEDYEEEVSFEDKDDEKEEEEDEEEEYDDEEETPKPKKGKKSNGAKSNGSASKGGRAICRDKKNKSLLSTPRGGKGANVSITEDNEERGKLAHLNYEFLNPKFIKDAKNRRPDHPDYDPRTLLVPEYFKVKQTPGIKQWWDFKAVNFDTVLFFKMGKFYEMYHMDAVIGVQELGLLHMRGEVAHCGFPEISYPNFASTLVEKGYKIARIEQTETPLMRDERNKHSTKKDKVVRREICQKTTKGVRFAPFQTRFTDNTFMPHAAYLCAITEKICPNENVEFGVCFIDTAVGYFHIGQFKDDRFYSRLRTLFAHYTPAQILYEKKKASANLLQLVNNMSAVKKDALQPNTEFWDANKTLTFLSEADYFGQSLSSQSQSVDFWPEALKQCISDDDVLELSAKPNWEMAIRSLGAVIWCLKDCLVEYEILSLRRFVLYEPVNADGTIVSSTPLPSATTSLSFMVLDGVTLRNLGVTEGPSNLLSVIDSCVTHFGRRGLRNWVVTPLASPDAISERLDAVDDMLAMMNDLKGTILPLLKSLPDLERLLIKIHFLGSKNRTKDHPDSRAQFFNLKDYSKSKIADLFSALKGFRTCEKIIAKMRTFHEGSSKLVTRILDEFPSLSDLITYFDGAFDHERASKEGEIIPKAGVDEEYDSSSQIIQDIHAEFNKYLKKVNEELHVKAVGFGSDKKRFQIEIPDKIRPPLTYEISSSRKGFKRYTTSKSRELLAKLMAAESSRELIVRDIARRIFEQFDNSREIWNMAMESIRMLDVLISLANFSRSQEAMCRPQVVHSDESFIDIEEGRHPCIPATSYIPNDFKLNNKSFLLLTGPNMGGKSTFMRQSALISILAHIGCYVPASKCILSVVDRVFTRVGANDNIGEGESTFYVEMSETASILTHATKDSLVLVDELGRGTATYDGTAIAYSVVKHLAELKARTIFSTHYHTLLDATQQLPQIRLGHMACMVENENEEDPTQETISFLYQMVEGPCPKSYGFNAARLAGISDDIIRFGHKKAKEMEAVINKVDAFRALCSFKSKPMSFQTFTSLVTSF